MNKIFPVVIILAFLMSNCLPSKKQNLIDYVNPFIGTDGHGHTYPGATMPFGMVQLSPDTRKDNWDGCSGYHYSDSIILGFSHTHLNGTGVGDYGDIRFMPVSGEIKLNPGDASLPRSGYSSRFSHDSEEAKPGYYKVKLDDHDILAELTATQRCGFHRYTFPQGEQPGIIIDLTESVVTEKNADLYLEIINDHAVCGYRKSSGWARDQHVYFYAEFSEPFINHGVSVSGNTIEQSESGEGNDVKAYLKFNGPESGLILARVGISGVSIEGAKKNLEGEINNWDFDQVRASAQSSWEKELSRVEVSGGKKEDMIKFYTALYHTFLAPNIFTDLDGKYRGNDGLTHQADGFQVYTVFSLWDTYRALHPLLTFLQPDLTVDFIRTFIDIHEKSGLLPVWELAGNETNCMIGYHAVPVIADAYFKGINGFDAEKAFEAMKNSAMQDQFGLRYYKELGYIPSEMESESISKTLEYAYDDWCIAIMARALGKEEDYSHFIRRAQNYKNLFDPDTKFIRGKRNGMFAEPFDPTEVNFMLTEANTWQYTFYVPQDITGLIASMGGDQLFEQKLDEMFTAEEDVSGREQADITGLIGQYAHGNEPSHHMAYLYDYVGKPFKTQQLVRRIMDDLYGPGPDGLCGNDDCGQMSAWFVMSAMGFYPVTPASGIYAIGSPLFNKIVIHLDNGKDFTIRADKNSPEKIYIHSARLNDKEYDRSYFIHEDLAQGGELAFTMSSEPDQDWATVNNNRPVSDIKDDLITPVPFFKAVSSSFQDSLLVELGHVDSMAQIFLDYSTETSDTFSLYHDPLHIGQTVTLKAYAELNGEKSMPVETSLNKINNNWRVQVKYDFSPQYAAGGVMALVDGQRGGQNFRTGAWQGYYGVDLEAVIDMGELRAIESIDVSFLQDQRSWIFMPEEVQISISADLKDFHTLAVIPNDIPQTIDEPVIEVFSKEALRQSGRFVKVVAKNIGTCPEWHIGAGDKAWIFVDEITIR